MAPTQFLIVWTELQDDGGRIVFQWNSRTLTAEDAFLRLQKSIEHAQAQRTRIVLIIHGRLGQNVRWESTASAPSKHQTRKVFTQWFTQAVQAQAALVRQRVMPPAFH